MEQTLRIVFMGTPEFSVTVLTGLLNVHYSIPLVITQPDKPKGRNRKVCPACLKAKALELGLEVWQPEKMKTNEVYLRLQSIQPDLIVTAAFGRLLSQKHLSIPPLGVLNVHASLLPNLRGAAPIQWAILNGFSETGITIMKTELAMDSGPILAQRKIPITADDSYASLERKLAELGSELLCETIPLYVNGQIKSIVQDDAHASYAPPIPSSQGCIIWERSAIEIDRLIRALYPAPGAYSTLNGRRIKFYKASVHPSKDSGMVPGTIIARNANSGLLVQTGLGILQINTLQPESKGMLSGYQLITGRYAQIGDIFMNPESTK